MLTELLNDESRGLTARLKILGSRFIASINAIAMKESKIALYRRKSLQQQDLINNAVDLPWSDGHVHPINVILVGLEMFPGVSDAGRCRTHISIVLRDTHFFASNESCLIPPATCSEVRNLVMPARNRLWIPGASIFL
jgi:hypothetical protein